jgi:hypothetical protein
MLSASASVKTFYAAANLPWLKSIFAMPVVPASPGQKNSHISAQNPAFRGEKREFALRHGLGLQLNIERLLSARPRCPANAYTTTNKAGVMLPTESPGEELSEDRGEVSAEGSLK